MTFIRNILTIMAAACGIAYCSPGALENFERFSQERAQLRLAEEKINDGDFAAAAALYGKAAANQRDQQKAAGYYLQQAQCYLRAKKAHKARQAYLKLLNSYLFHIPVEEVVEQLRELSDLFWRGEGTFLGISDPDAAIELYRMVIKYQPSINLSLNDRLVLADKLQSREHYEDAVKLCQETIKLSPENPDVRLRLGKLLVLLAKKGDGDGQRIRAAMREARSFLQLAPQSDPRRPEAEEIIRIGGEMCAAQLLDKAVFYMNKYHYRPAVSRRYLHDLLRDYPDASQAAEARALLEKLPPMEENAK